MWELIKQHHCHNIILTLFACWQPRSNLARTVQCLSHNCTSYCLYTRHWLGGSTRFSNCNFRPCNARLSRREYWLHNSPNWWENHYFSTPFHSQLIPNHNVIQPTEHAHIFLGFCLRSSPKVVCQYVSGFYFLHLHTSASNPGRGCSQLTIGPQTCICTDTDVAYWQESTPPLNWTWHIRLICVAPHMNCMRCVVFFKIRPAKQPLCRFLLLSTSLYLPAPLVVPIFLTLYLLPLPVRLSPLPLHLLHTLT